jgi:type IV pilus assembly protein PilV
MATMARKLPTETVSPHHCGSTLIEVMVSLLIVSTGVIGMFGLQTVSLMNTHNAYLRTQANFLAEDIIERMHANKTGVESGSYVLRSAQLSDACISRSGCSSDAMARHDLAEWSAALAVALPEGAGIVCIDSSPGDGTPSVPQCDGRGEHIAVKVWWDGLRQGIAEQLLVISVFF